ncbi:MAG TPA: aspartate/glutamate racemase family protein, partial [Afifellaceae bacterium]|nr:aspartate/glutamate racemase family protein [Afifellaceae bacterium]
VHGLTPAEIQLVAPTFIAAFRQAEREGYDAAVPLGMLDLGVDGGRSAVDIPVIGPCEASLHIASLLGDRIGAIVYHDLQIPFSQAIVRRYGMERWMAGWRTVGFDLPDLAANHEAVVENFVREARALIADDGAEVIIPMGISQCPIHIKPDWRSAERGVPVVEGIGAPIRMAAMLAGMGLRHSRKRWAKSASGAPEDPSARVQPGPNSPSPARAAGGR